MACFMPTLQRLFISQPLQYAGDIILSASQSHYLVNVLRKKQGDHLLVFNGEDGEWLAQCDKLDKKATGLKLIEQVRPQTHLKDITYCFAPLKQARLDYMVQKAAEMGAKTLQPVLTEYTQVRRLNLDRMRANVVEAAEQCGLLSIPHVKEPLLFMDYCETLQQEPKRLVIFCDETLETASPLSTLQKARELLSDYDALDVLIGPEGGFNEKERYRLNQSSSCLSISLGPRILRADTAAVSALTLVQAVMGDWHS
jgi:16S rRNA (uracil1498-N3)-methyltransferase